MSILQIGHELPREGAHHCERHLRESAHLRRQSFGAAGVNSRLRRKDQVYLCRSSRSDMSYHAKERITANDIFENRLIFGDNLLALQALTADFAGKIKCIYVDPPDRT